MTRPSVIFALGPVLGIAFGFALGLTAACGPTIKDGSGDDVDPNAPCKPGRVVSCYSGTDGTAGVGPCAKGTRTCSDQGAWGGCVGEVIPLAESCSDGVDNNCNGQTDEDIDADGDGFTTCGGDLCDSTECTQPELVNPGAFDAPGNNLDDDCDGIVDNGAVKCDTALPNGTGQAIEYAKAIELCQQTTFSERRWGVINTELTLADGTGIPAARAHAIRRRFGTGVTPRSGDSLILLSTGAAAGQGDANPGYQDFQEVAEPGNNKSSPFPSDFLAANGNRLPNAPGCVGPDGNSAMDPIMLTLTIRVPTNARSFKLQTNFFSSEFPEYTCSKFNDFFVVLLDSMYTGASPNPADKNLAFYQPMGSMQKYPVGVNLASGNTGLFTQCVNGTIGCAVGGSKTITTCTSTAQLAGTGLDTSSSGDCNSNSLQGGGTGWLQTSGNVKPGEIIKLRIAIWDTSDHVLDSIAAIDAFEWSVDLAQPGTVIF
ncbi:MAG TPA: choice-of-anchor L domain-containing protein [Kofleriaceae bacterium]|nr:choice-of-anchor L domain-containing protein [Kofleriaceae bacterium]